MKRAALIAAMASIVVAVPTAVKAAELVMFRQPLCEWCDTWDQEIGGVYDKTAEGRLAPLRKFDIGAPRPAELAHVSPVVFTPTFVLVHRGREYGRIQGYPGAAFFWDLLDQLLARLPQTD